MSCSGRVLNWVQALSRIESFRKKIFFPQVQVQELAQIIVARVKIKDKCKTFLQIVFKNQIKVYLQPL